MTRRTALLALASLLAGLLLPVLAAGPAQAAARVSIDNGAGAAQIDGTYSTRLTVSGSGFQSVKNGHGGIYVWFGVVNGAWKPSQGGVSGVNYRYIPDSEGKSNQGFQRFVSFPGSDTASSAHATMSDSGSWRTTITVPGPTFKVVGRDGSVDTVDCRKMQCGVITIGAHGQKNANNETFTPVSVGTVASTAPSAEDPASGAEEPSVATDPGTAIDGEQPAAVKKRTGKPKLTVDRTSAVAGRVLSFSVSGLIEGQQISVVFDDGRAAAGPFLVGDNGQLAGVITLPVDLPAGTYELRVFGVEKPPSVKFAVRAADEVTTAATEPASNETDDSEKWGMIFAGFAAAVLLVALARLLLMARGRRAQS